MKTKTIKSLLALFLLSTVLFLSSCQDDENASSPDDPKKKEDVKKILAFREDLSFINRFVNESTGDVSSEEGRISPAKAAFSRMRELAPCAVANEEELPDGSTKITLDFGDGCQTEDGIEVAGKVVMVFSFTETTFNYALEFFDFTELTSGENQGEVANGTVEVSFIIEASKFVQQMEQDLTITYANNVDARLMLSQKAELTEAGMHVTSFSTSGNLADGGSFSISLSKALVYDFSCEGDFPVAGEEVMTFQGNSIRVNYGSGGCDKEYTAK